MELIVLSKCHTWSARCSSSSYFISHLFTSFLRLIIVASTPLNKPCAFFSVIPEISIWTVHVLSISYSFLVPSSCRSLTSSILRPLIKNLSKTRCARSIVPWSLIGLQCKCFDNIGDITQNKQVRGILPNQAVRIHNESITGEVREDLQTVILLWFRTGLLVLPSTVIVHYILSVNSSKLRLHFLTVFISELLSIYACDFRR